MPHMGNLHRQLNLLAVRSVLQALLQLLAYVVELEAAATALAGLLDEGLNVQNVWDAHERVRGLDVLARKLLTREQRAVLGIDD